MSNLELKGLRNLIGLDSLLAESKIEEFAKESIFHLPIHCLITGKYQPRTIIDDESLQELATSIKSQGIILPLLVRRLDTEKFEIIAGERRWRAAMIIGLKTVPAIIKDIPDQTACAFALIENIQRESLNAIDEALAFERLITEFFLTHEEIAERVGRSRSAVTNLLRLLGLDGEVKDLVRKRKIEMGHARALLILDGKQQREIAAHIINKNLSVREAEKLVQNIKSQQPAVSYDNPFKDQILQWQRTLSTKFSSSVKVNLNAKGEGKVIISVRSPDEVEWLIRNLK
jgi:ParB family chromosome partitioning protein